MGSHINWFRVCPDLHLQLWKYTWEKQEKWQSIWQWKSGRIQDYMATVDSPQAHQSPDWLVKVTTHSINGGLFGKVGEISFFGETGKIFRFSVYHSSSFSWASPSSLSLVEARTWSKLLSSPWFNISDQFFDHHHHHHQEMFLLFFETQFKFSQVGTDTIMVSVLISCQNRCSSPNMEK